MGQQAVGAAAGAVSAHLALARLEEQRGDAEGGEIGWPAQEIVPLPPQIHEALRGEGQLELTFVSASGEETRRVVSTVHVTAFAGYLYLIAICHLRNEQRTFGLDRIIEMRSGP